MHGAGDAECARSKLLWDDAEVEQVLIDGNGSSNTDQDENVSICFCIFIPQRDGGNEYNRVERNALVPAQKAWSEMKDFAIKKTAGHAKCGYHEDKRVRLFGEESENSLHIKMSLHYIGRFDKAA